MLMEVELLILMISRVFIMPGLTLKSNQGKRRKMKSLGNFWKPLNFTTISEGEEAETEV